MKTLKSFGLKDPQGNLVHVVASNEFDVWVIFRTLAQADPIEAQRAGWEVVPVTIEAD